jgi:hypothetical protein
MPTLHSHTYCQVAPANATTKSWQRVFLSNRTTKTTDKQADDKEARLPNSTYPKGGVSCSKDSFVVAESFVLRINICSKKPAHRKSANRCMPFKKNEYEKFN